MMDSIIFSNVMVKSKLSRHPCTAGPKDASSGHPAGFVVAMAVEFDGLMAIYKIVSLYRHQWHFDSQMNHFRW